MKEYDVICAGLSLVNFPIYPTDESIFRRDVTQVDPIVLLPGGDAANQAIVISRLGNRTALLTKRGDDHFGKIMLDLLNDFGNGIDVSKIAVDEKNSTGVCAMMIRPDGQRSFCTHRGALLHFGLDDINVSLLKTTRIVSIGGLMSLPGFDGKGTAEFFRLAKEAGAVTVADTKKDLWEIGLDGIRNTLKYTDYFFPSLEEATAISGKERPENMADVFLGAGAKHVGIKLGKDGCYFKDTREEFYLPVYPSEVVDTTGAGDNFMSGFITGLLHNWEIQDCCRFAGAAGAICVSQVGPNTAVESFDQVMRFMKGSNI